MSNPQPTRRAFVRTVTAAGGGAALTAFLAACSTGTGGAAAETPAPFELPASEVPVGGGVVLNEHSAVVTQPSAGEFHAFVAICTHKQCPLSSVEGLGAYCACHSSYFDIATGHPVAGPAQEALPELPVTVSGDTLRIG
ncbi:Rieske (2Fe-2S) protein [Gulosibacter sp. GYB002]|uniref:Rieske (2Fe-2S) protein n=1 Tax=Gulosibacter sp. GYB002 TaxID=2994391 RepID=UPI002F96292C